MQLVSKADLPDQPVSKATTLQAQTLYRQAKATEVIHNTNHPPLEGALVLLFQSPMVATALRIILSKISAVAMDINFFNRDTTRQLTVICDHQWGVTKVGSLHGLPMAWVRECRGEEQVCIRLPQAGYPHPFQEKTMGAYFSVDSEECHSLPG